MDLNYQSHIPENFHPTSKVWIYQSNRLFTLNEVFTIEKMLTDFTTTWQSHGDAVKGYANLFFGQFIILMADETVAQLGGCSISSSMQVIKEIEKLFKVELFNRHSLAFIVKNKIEILPLQQLNYALENNFITANTLYFNNLVANKEELLSKWIVSIKESWLKTKIQTTV
ncbi:MAG: hypothetical protein JST94_02050 [Bacteroidetes bacterium]|nr:hypothetical protein [Bacteroidota bacterium]MBS1639798.1 hypothetical protein [Bacteroidota bacterium]MBS1642582.1 hypothetical protein [Bacteroidota bacterium]MBS1670228.1 hypothetical protein [Bacteroidota bacterium]